MAPLPITPDRWPGFHVVLWPWPDIPDILTEQQNSDNCHNRQDLVAIPGSLDNLWRGCFSSDSDMICACLTSPNKFQEGFVQYETQLNTSNYTVQCSVWCLVSVKLGVADLGNPYSVK